MKQLFTYLLPCLFFFSVKAQNVGIGTAAPAQRLEVVGNARVTSLAGTGVRPVFANADGDLTTTGPAVVSTAWELTGNAGTTSATNFLGTTDAQDLVIRTNNVEEARFETTGEFVVNNAAAVAGDQISGWNFGAGNGTVGVTNGTGNGAFGIELAGGNAVFGQAAGTGRAVVALTTGASALPTLLVQNQAGTGLTGFFVKNAVSAAPVVEIDNNAGTGIGLGILQNSDGSAAVINQVGDNRAVEVVIGAAVTDLGVSVFNAGTNRSLNVQQDNVTNAVPAVFASNQHDGTNPLATAVLGQSIDGIRGGIFVAGRDFGAQGPLPGLGINLNTTRSIGLIGQGGTGAAIGDNVGVFGSGLGQPTWGFGVVGEGDWFATFANGDDGASGGKFFVIDHPADPENKLLRHFSIESDEALLIYRGLAELDADGRAVVELPAYVELVNRNFTYDLTPIGAPMPLLHIAERFEDGKFRIAGGVAGESVSWKLTGERNDPYFQQRPEKRLVELEKKPADKGRYFHPELYNQSEEKALFHGVTLTREQLEANTREAANPKLKPQADQLGVSPEQAQERAQQYKTTLQQQESR